MARQKSFGEFLSEIAFLLFFLMCWPVSSFRWTVRCYMEEIGGRWAFRFLGIGLFGVLTAGLTAILALNGDWLRALIPFALHGAGSVAQWALAHRKQYGPAPASRRNSPSPRL